MMMMEREREGWKTFDTSETKQEKVSKIKIKDTNAKSNKQNTTTQT